MYAMTERVTDEGKIHLTCTVERCHYSCTYGGGFEGEEGFEKARQSFITNHLDQHAEGKTPDVWLRVTYEGSCSRCGRRFEYEQGDTERVWCECGASWNTYGTDGRTDIPEED